MTFKYIILMIIMFVISVKEVRAETSPYFCFNAMTYNILGISFITSPFFSWKLRKPLVFELLEASSPDLLGLQEDSTEQRDDIVSHFLEYGLVDTTLDGFSHRAILYKESVFSLVESGEFIVQSSLGRKGTWAKLRENKTGTQIFVINGHFIAGLHSDIFERRLDAAVDFATKIALLNTENSPVVMLGDLNGRFGEPYIEYLISDKDTIPDVFYPEGFRKLNSPTEWGFDANFDFRPVTYDSTIDYVLTSDDLTFSKATFHVWSVLDNDGNLTNASDHPAVSEKICHGNIAYMVPILGIVQ